MIKYSDVKNDGTKVEIVTGPGQGQSGIVKEASKGRLKVEVKPGVVIEVDETQTRVKE